MCIKSQSSPTFSTFFGSNLITCKVTRPDIRSQFSRGKSVVNKINLSWTDYIDVYYPMDEPTPVHIEGSPDFFQADPKICRQHCATQDATHGMSESSGPNPNIKPLGRIWWNRVILLDQFFSIWTNAQSNAKHKVRLRHMTINLQQLVNGWEDSGSVS